MSNVFGLVMGYRSRRMDRDGGSRWGGRLALLMISVGLLIAITSGWGVGGGYETSGVTVDARVQMV